MTKILKELNLTDELIPKTYTFKYYKEDDNVGIVDEQTDVEFRIPYVSMIRQLQKAQELRKYYGYKEEESEI